MFWPLALGLVQTIFSKVVLREALLFSQEREPVQLSVCWLTFAPRGNPAWGSFLQAWQIQGENILIASHREQM